MIVNLVTMMIEGQKKFCIRENWDDYTQYLVYLCTQNEFQKWIVVSTIETIPKTVMDAYVRFSFNTFSKHENVISERTTRPGQKQN